MSAIELTIPDLELVSEANAHEVHWNRMRRAQAQHKAVDGALLLAQRPALPCEVRITRLGPKELDTDNLDGSAKHVRDRIALWLVPLTRVIRRGKRAGTVERYGDDSDPRISWHVGQEHAPTYGVRIAIRPWSPSAVGSRVTRDGSVTHTEVTLDPARLSALARALTTLADGGPSVGVTVHGVRVTYHRTETPTE